MYEMEGPRRPVGPGWPACRLPHTAWPRHRLRAPAARTVRTVRPPFRSHLRGGPASVVSAVLLPIGGAAQGLSSGNFLAFPLSTSLSTTSPPLSPAAAGLSAGPSTGLPAGPPGRPAEWRGSGARPAADDPARPLWRSVITPAGSRPSRNPLGRPDAACPRVRGRSCPLRAATARTASPSGRSRFAPVWSA